MSNPVISWKQGLQNPTTPGTYPVKGHGMVTVTQQNIEAARKFNGDVTVEICDTSTFGSDIKQFIIGQFIPTGNEIESSFSANPVRLLQGAIRIVPEVKYALGVVGIAAAVAIILGIIRDPKIAFFGIAIMFALMFILVIFANAVKNIPGIRWLAALLAWAVAILFVATMVAVFTSYVFGVPETFAQYLRGKSSVDFDVNDGKTLPVGIVSPTLPGETGWIFAGYFDSNRETFIEGPYVSVVGTTRRGLRRFVEIGDRIRLNVSRKLIIVDFRNYGTLHKLLPPEEIGIISGNDETDVILPANTEWIVRDVSEAHWQGNPNSAMWLRVVSVPK